jgi:hypothetical protein
MQITTEAATVYRGGGRRWFTKLSACRAEARAKIKARCACDTFDTGVYGTGSITCSLHNADRYPKILRRLTRIYMAATQPSKKEE